MDILRIYGYITPKQIVVNVDKVEEIEVIRIYNDILSKQKLFNTVATFINDRVLVIIPAYNAELTIADSILSVINQTYRNIKIVVVNDNSQDNTLNVIKRFHDVKVYNLTENVGCYNAINCALYNEKDYDYFILHGADDIMANNKIEIHVGGILKGDYLASISGYKRVDYESKVNMKTVSVGDSMVLYSKKVFDKLGYYDDTRFGGDSEYLDRFRLVYEKEKLINVNEILLTAYFLGNNLTQIIDDSQRKEYIVKYKKSHYYMRKQDLFFNYTNQYYNYDITTEKLGRLKPKLSVALPIYKGSDIAWLALEGLCNQKDVKFGWELIICEEVHDDMIGFEYIKPYFNRLKGAGCVLVTYICPKNRISLPKKWKIIGENIDSNSKIFVLQAADDYSPALRLSKTYDLIVNNNYDWIDFTKGYFYSVISKRLVLFDYKCKTNLNMAFKSKYSRNIPDTILFKGIDNFLYEHCLNSNKDFKCFHDPTLMEDALDIHGQNQISLTRETFFDSKPDIFHKVNKTLNDLEIDSEIIDRIKTINSIY